ncbi:HlyD family type I secretion periplasmic adaptor subunit [Paracoccus onubensis]|uniref:HlyD family type I secretion periplasmic adaptor subunit n=1 Tax=Paracoccus onubensis TaxID=1675788 RepID=UPI00272FBF21|nr:HlyD family type I secretion periplasmic adaptor subunit [Paracoccus onubensis]MDP0928009.1 HlyD family type I secretion periplasmic adaptor subunit [Paracoccus onubensis]
MSQPASVPQLAEYRDPMRPAIWGCVIVAVFLLVLLVWGNSARLASSALAEGSLQVMAQRQSVQHPHGGVISQIHVIEGQTVARGELLIELDETEARASRNIAESEVIALQALQARLECERDQSDPLSCLQEFADGKEDHPEMAAALANETALLQTRARKFRTETGMLTSRVSQLREQISGLDAQSQGLARQRKLLEEELETAHKLLDSGLTSRNRTRELERAIAGVIGDEGSRSAEIASARQEISEAELAVARLEDERINEITDQLRNTRSALAEAQPRLDAAILVEKRGKILAPVSGQIVGLSVFTEGGVIQAGQQLMDIVPDDNPIIVEARLPLSDINGIAVGDSTDIRLTGIPRKDRPELMGEIISISADKMTDSQSGLSYFSVRIGLDADEIRRSQVPLRPGMPAEVVIPKGSRTMVSYLLGPLLDEITHAFREE